MRKQAYEQANGDYYRACRRGCGDRGGMARLETAREQRGGRPLRSPGRRLCRYLRHGERDRHGQSGDPGADRQRGVGHHTDAPGLVQLDRPQGPGPDHPRSHDLSSHRRFGAGEPQLGGCQPRKREGQCREDEGPPRSREPDSFAGRAPREAGPHPGKPDREREDGRADGRAGLPRVPIRREGGRSPGPGRARTARSGSVQSLADSHQESLRRHHHGVQHQHRADRRLLPADSHAVHARHQSDGHAGGHLGR